MCVPHLLRLAVGLGALAIFTAAIPSFAVDYYWGGDGTNPGGTGPWSNTDARWGTSTSGPFPSNQNDVWGGGAANRNIFAGSSAGTVTVSDTINVRWMNFTTPGYIITGGTIARPSGGGPRVDGTADATIESNFSLPSGIRLSKFEDNTVTLNGWNNRGTTVFEGTIIAGANARIGIARIEAPGTLVLHSGQSGNLRLADGSAQEMTHIAGGTLASSNSAGIDVTSYNASVSGTLNFGTATYTNPITISDNQTSAGSRTLNVAANTPVMFSGNLTGAGGSYRKLGSGTLTLSGNNSFSGGLTLGANSQVAGQLNINSATALGAGTFTIDGATTNAVIDNTSGAAITLINNNPFVIGSDFTFIGTNDLNLGTGAVNKGSADKTITVTNSGATLTIGGNISVNGGVLEKAGAGKLVLSGNNAYTGGTKVSAGTLFVNNSTGSGLGTGTATVNGGTLGGTGAFSGPVIVNAGGTLAPGTSIESLGSGSITFDAGTFQYEINTSTASADLLYGGDNSTLTLLNSPVLTLIDLAANNSFVPLGTKFTLIAYDGAWNLGTFAGRPDDSLFVFAGNQWLINYDDPIAGSNFQGDATNFGTSFVTITATPEPTTLRLMILAMLALGLFAWRNRRPRPKANVA